MGELPSDPVVAKPTKTRWLVLAGLCLAAALAYVSRNAIAVAESTVRADLGLTKQQSGWLMSAFFFSYALCSIPAAQFGQRFGSRRALPFFATVWSIATAATALVSGLGGFLAARIVQGVAQSGLFPTTTVTVAKWFPLTGRGFATGALGSCMSLGGALCAWLTGVLLEVFEPRVAAGWNWRLTFLLFAVPGIIWAVWFWWWFRDEPDQHRSVNRAELQLIRGERTTEAESARPPAQTGKPALSTPWLALFSSPALWWLCGQQTFRAAGYMFFTSWFATYLQETRGVSIAHSGFLNMLPLIVVVAAGLVGGAFSDWLLKRTASRDVARRWMSILSLLACAGLIFWALVIENALAAVLVISAGSFFAALASPCAYAMTIDMGGSHVATVNATMNMTGNFGAWAFPIAVPWLLARFGNWDAVLVVFGALYVVGALFWLLLKPEGTIVEQALCPVPRTQIAVMPQSFITEVKTPQSRCRFALAWADITPPIGIYHRMWGAAKHERATGVHRPLRATVAVFETANTHSSSSETRQILLAIDHCVLGAVEHEQLITHVAQASGQPKETILVVFSHTHGAGLMGLERASLPGGDLIPGYLQSVAERAAELVSECLSRLAPVGIVYGQGCCSLAAHRDFFDEEQKQFVCGFNPAGPADDTVLVARVTDESGRLIATVINYACHPTTLAWDNTLISPDYVGALREVVEQATSAPCLFLQGASGELGPREGYVGDTAVADRNGRQLGFAALSALTALPAAGTHFRYTGPVVSGATLGAWVHEPLPANDAERKSLWQLWRWRELLSYRPGQPTAEQVEAELKQFQADEDAARTVGDTERAADCRAMAERKRRLLHRLSQLPRGETFPLQVALWRMGDAFWLGVQGESYSLLQTELRQRFPGTPIVVASIAADWGASYLPPAKIYGTGIYQESIAVVAPGSLEQLIESIATRVSLATRNA